MKTFFFSILGAIVGVILGWIFIFVFIPNTDFDMAWLYLEIAAMIGLIIGGVLSWQWRKRKYSLTGQSKGRAVNDSSS